MDLQERGLQDEYGARTYLGGIGRTKLYELTGSGELRSVKVGRRRLWPTDALREYVDHLQAAG